MPRIWMVHGLAIAVLISTAGCGTREAPPASTEEPPVQIKQRPKIGPITPGAPDSPTPEKPAAP